MTEKDIIWLASYPRSGNTLLRMVLWHYFGLRSGSAYKESDGLSSADYRDAIGSVVQKGNLNDPHAFFRQGAAIIKTHDLHDERHEGLRAIYVVRDGRAAVVSYWHFLRDFGDDECTMGQVIRGVVDTYDWSGHLRAWNPKDRPNTLLIRYEDMIGNIGDVVGEIGQFLKRKATGNGIPSFEKMRMLNRRFFRDGTADGWRRDLSGTDLRLFWSLHGGAMEEYGYDTAEDRQSVYRQELRPKKTFLAKS